MEKVLFVWALALGALVAVVAKRQVKQQRVGVGIGVVVWNQTKDKILLGKRKSSHGEGLWAFPGGWLEIGEEFEACAIRELQEETGIVCSNEKKCYVLPVAPSNNIFPSTHSASVFVCVELDGSEEPRVMEPNKCQAWEWFTPKQALQDLALFPSARHLLTEYNV